MAIVELGVDCNKTLGVVTIDVPNCVSFPYLSLPQPEPKFTGPKILESLNCRNCIRFVAQAQWYYRLFSKINEDTLATKLLRGRTIVNWPPYIVGRNTDQHQLMIKCSLLNDFTLPSGVDLNAAIPCQRKTCSITI
jgi:hypothetical protein